MELYELVNSAGFQQAARLFDLLKVLAAVGMIGVFAYIVLQPPLGRPDRDEDHWLVLIATLRDSFVVNVLYLALDFERGWNSAVAPRPLQPGFLEYARTFAGFLDPIILAVIAFVVVRRLLVLQRWLDRRRGG